MPCTFEGRGGYLPADSIHVCVGTTGGKGGCCLRTAIGSSRRGGWAAGGSAPCTSGSTTVHLSPSPEMLLGRRSGEWGGRVGWFSSLSDLGLEGCSVMKSPLAFLWFAMVKLSYGLPRIKGVWVDMQMTVTRIYWVSQFFFCQRTRSFPVGH